MSNCLLVVYLGKPINKNVHIRYIHCGELGLENLVFKISKLGLGDLSQW